jgi:opacity protein-like surface antigen
MKNVVLKPVSREIAFLVVLMGAMSWSDDSVLALQRAGSGALASGPGLSTIINKIDVQRGNRDVVVVILADGTLQYDITELDRNRLVIDVSNAKTVRDLSSSISVQHPLLKEIRIGRYPKKVRLVLDRTMPTRYRVEPGGQTVAITLAGKPDDQFTSASAAATATAMAPPQLHGVPMRATVVSSPRTREPLEIMAAAAQAPAEPDATRPSSQPDSTSPARPSGRTSRSSAPPDESQEGTGAERYVAVFGGVTLPADATKNRDIDSTSGVTLSDLDLARSGVVGVKAGAYPLGEKSWIGMETEFFYTNPHVKQQDVTVTGPGGSLTANLPGSRVRIATVAFNLLLRYPGTVIQPYVGAGLGIFWGRVSGPLGTASDTSPGFNGLAGVRFRLLKYLTAFGEYKYNRATFDFGGDLALHSLYQAHHLIGGVAFEF